MKKYIQNYIKKLGKDINNGKKFSENEISEFIMKIQFFQHERLIHLLVTLAFAFFAILFMVLGMLSYYFLIPFAFLIVFVIFYIIHYFYLENSIQCLYKLLDQIKR